jgi:hypothetical protein
MIDTKTDCFTFEDRFFKTEMPPASNVKAGGKIRLRQTTAILELTLFAALAISAATASGFDT